MKGVNIPENATAILYCLRDGDKSIFLDRKDRIIKRFDTYPEAIDYAKKNNHLIDRGSISHTQTKLF